MLSIRKAVGVNLLCLSYTQVPIFELFPVSGPFLVAFLHIVHKVVFLLHLPIPVGLSFLVPHLFYHDKSILILGAG